MASVRCGLIMEIISVKSMLALVLLTRYFYTKISYSFCLYLFIFITLYVYGYYNSTLYIDLQSDVSTVDFLLHLMTHFYLFYCKFWNQSEFAKLSYKVGQVVWYCTHSISLPLSNYRYIDVFTLFFIYIQLIFLSLPILQLPNLMYFLSTLSKVKPLLGFDIITSRTSKTIASYR